MKHAYMKAAACACAMLLSAGITAGAWGGPGSGRPDRDSDSVPAPAKVSWAGTYQVQSHVVTVETDTVDSVSLPTTYDVVIAADTATGRYAITKILGYDLSEQGGIPIYTFSQHGYRYPGQWGGGFDGRGGKAGQGEKAIAVFNFVKLQQLSAGEPDTTIYVHNRGHWGHGGAKADTDTIITVKGAKSVVLYAGRGRYSSGLVTLTLKDSTKLSIAPFQVGILKDRWVTPLACYTKNNPVDTTTVTPPVKPEETSWVGTYKITTPWDTIANSPLPTDFKLTIVADSVSGEQLATFTWAKDSTTGSVGGFIVETNKRNANAAQLRIRGAELTFSGDTRIDRWMQWMIYTGVRYWGKYDIVRNDDSTYTIFGFNAATYTDDDDAPAKAPAQVSTSGTEGSDYLLMTAVRTQESTQSSGVTTVSVSKPTVVSTRYYNLAGQLTRTAQPGICIQVQTLSNGQTVAKKIVVK